MDDLVISIVFVFLAVIVLFIYAGPVWARGRSRSSDFPESCGEALPSAIIEIAANENNDFDDATKLDIAISLMLERKQVYISTIQLFDKLIELDGEDELINKQATIEKEKITSFISEIDNIVSRMRKNPYAVKQDFSVIKYEKLAFLHFALSDKFLMEKYYHSIALSLQSKPGLAIELRNAKISYDLIKQFVLSLKTSGYASHEEFSQRIDDLVFSYCASIGVENKDASDLAIELINNFFYEVWGKDEIDLKYGEFQDNDNTDVQTTALDNLAIYCENLQNENILVSHVVAGEISNLISVATNLAKRSSGVELPDTEDGSAISNASTIQQNDLVEDREENQIPALSKEIIFYHNTRSRYALYLLALILISAGIYAFVSLPHASWAYILVAGSIVPIGFGAEMSGMATVPLVTVGNDYIDTNEVHIERSKISKVDRFGVCTMHDGTSIYLPFHKLTSKDAAQVHSLLQNTITHGDAV